MVKCQSHKLEVGGSNPPARNKVIGDLLKLVKRMLLKSIRSVTSWRQGSNPWVSAKYEKQNDYLWERVCWKEQNMFC